MKTPSMDESAWELGFDSAEDLYPDSPTNQQPDIWLVRRISPKYNPRLVNRKGSDFKYLVIAKLTFFMVKISLFRLV